MCSRKVAGEIWRGRKKQINLPFRTDIKKKKCLFICGCRDKQIWSTPHLFFMTATCNRDTYSLYRSPSDATGFPPPAPLVVVYIAAVAAVNQPRSDMLIAMVTCVWPRARAFLSECVTLSDQHGFACDRERFEKKKKKKKGRRNQK